MRGVSGNEDTGEDNISISLGTCSSHLDKFSLRQYVVCKYDIDRWTGNIKELSFENGDALISFMHPKITSKKFHWPVREDLCWVPVQHIITAIDPPLISKTGRVHKLTAHDEVYNIM